MKRSRCEQQEEEEREFRGDVDFLSILQDFILSRCFQPPLNMIPEAFECINITCTCPTKLLHSILILLRRSQGAVVIVCVWLAMMSDFC